MEDLVVCSVPLSASKPVERGESIELELAPSTTGEVSCSLALSSELRSGRMLSDGAPSPSVEARREDWLALLRDIDTV